ncbi:MAG: recombinase family protein [Clostridia bacterium]|nr:recombinase family protein [Clostridia bacterium]
MKTAVIYARYSSDSQTEQSIEGQLRVCNEYAEKNDIVIVDTYIDRAMTGTNDNRPAFRKMIKDSDKKAWDFVLVYKLDRFSRNKYETAIHKKTLRDNGVKVVSAMENIPDTPEGIILESLLEGMNQYYSAELSQKVKRGMRESRSKGNFTGGYVLFGYRVENKKVIIHEDEAKIVRRIFEECASGKFIKTILDEIREQGILNRGKPFGRNAMYQMLSQERYTGIYRHGDEVFTNIYPQIIPDSLFAAVKIKKDINKYGKHKPNVYYLLKNKLICGYCGKPVNSDSGTSRNGSIMRYYKCSGKRANKNCSLNPVRKEMIENLVVDTTYEALTEADLLYIADNIIELQKEKTNDESLLNILLAEFTATEKAINNLLNAIEQGIFTNSTKERLERLEEQKSELVNKIALEKSKTKLLISKEEIIGYLRTAIKKEPMQLIDCLVKKVILYNDKVEIHYNYTDSTKPDGNEDRRAFVFYECEKSYLLEHTKLRCPPITLTYKITLFM